MKVPLGQCNIPFLSESHFSINHPSIPSLEDLHFFFSQCYSLLSLGQSISYSTPSLCPNLQKLYLCQTFFFFSYCPVITSIDKSDSFLSCKAVFYYYLKIVLDIVIYNIVNGRAPYTNVQPHPVSESALKVLKKNSLCLISSSFNFFIQNKGSFQFLNWLPQMNGPGCSKIFISNPNQ